MSSTLLVALVRVMSVPPALAPNLPQYSERHPPGVTIATVLVRLAQWATLPPAVRRMRHHLSRHQSKRATLPPGDPVQNRTDVARNCTSRVHDGSRTRNHWDHDPAASRLRSCTAGQARLELAWSRSKGALGCRQPTTHCIALRGQDSNLRRLAPEASWPCRQTTPN